MLKHFLGLSLGVMFIGGVGIANATMVSTRTGSYGHASNGTTQWQCLGHTQNNDGVTWSVKRWKFWQ